LYLTQRSSKRPRLLLSFWLDFQANRTRFQRIKKRLNSLIEVYFQMILIEIASGHHLIKVNIFKNRLKSSFV
jgi:hypothetical protein